MPKTKSVSADASESRRMSLRKKPAPAVTETIEPKKKAKKAAAKPKKEVEKAKPEEEEEAPAENGEAKDEAPSTGEDKKAEDAE